MLNSLPLFWHVKRDIDRAKQAKLVDKKRNEQQQRPAAKPDTFDTQKPSEGLPKGSSTAKPDKALQSAYLDHFMRLLADLNNPF